MLAYYNEHEPFAAEWLRRLIAEGLIADGDVDERSITEVTAGDVAGYDQCHWFAGLGGWSYALRLAGITDDRPIWSGSCPCQPFSAAGRQKGTDDERHLWPEWFRLIRECRPVTIFGEQVSSAVGHGWLDLVSSDLEGEGYACGAAVLGAHSVGAPHIRQRLWFVADAAGQRRVGVNALLRAEAGRRGPEAVPEAPRRGHAGIGVDDAFQSRLEGQSRHGTGSVRQPREVPEPDRPAPKAGAHRGLGDSSPGGLGIDGGAPWSGRHAAQSIHPWSDVVWLPCSDGKARPTQPGLHPLAARVPGRVGMLRAYGNSIVPQTAAEFIKAWQAVKLEGEMA